MLDPLLAGVLGAALTTWVTFVPCFLWIFLGAPYIEALRGNRALAAALTAITAAVVGVILNLARVVRAARAVRPGRYHRNPRPHVALACMATLDPVRACPVGCGHRRPC